MHLRKKLSTNVTKYAIILQIQAKEMLSNAVPPPKQYKEKNVW